MPGKTPIWSWPYPAYSEPSDGPFAFQAGLEAAEATVNKGVTPHTAGTLTAGVAPTVKAVQVRYLAQATATTTVFAEIIVPIPAGMFDGWQYAAMQPEAVTTPPARIAVHSISRATLTATSFFVFTTANAILASTGVRYLVQIDGWKNL